jgi:hypothetical protein
MLVLVRVVRRVPEVRAVPATAAQSRSNISAVIEKEKPAALRQNDRRHEIVAFLAARRSFHAFPANTLFR